ncbi:MAG: hypothetical protein OXP66_13080 [Candidatus Tectomicrobia bacterium]|nr:hypothetical protein [Candidatus Tectomicrobia bacterium]
MQGTRTQQGAGPAGFNEAEGMKPPDIAPAFIDTMNAASRKPVGIPGNLFPA